MRTRPGPRGFAPPLRVIGPALAVLLLSAGAAPAGSAPPAPGSPPFPCSQGERVRLAAPASGAYHSGYFSPTTDETTVRTQSIDAFEALAQKPVALVVFSNHWGRRGRVDIRFPTAEVQAIWDHGAVPDVRLQPWSKLWETPDPVVSMQRIVDGRWDGAIARWFRRAKVTGIPMMVEFGVEVNGEWFPWNGKWNGGGEAAGYGDPSYPDGPERFRDAFRHIVDISRRPDVDASNVTWMFHVDADGWPRRWWNTPAYYYPGDAYVDWIGVSDYGEQIPSGKPSHWFPFTEKLGDPADPQSSYSQIRALSAEEPLALIEFGVAEDPEAGDKAQWIADAFATVTSTYYDFRIVSYWHERWRNGSGKISNLRIDSSPGALGAYRTAVADPFFVSTPEFTCG